MRLLSRLRLVRNRCLLHVRLAHVAGVLLVLLVLLASSLLGRRRFYLRCLSLSLLGRHLRGLGLFRVLVGVFVMGIAIYHINREFGSIEVDRLSALKG